MNSFTIKVAGQIIEIATLHARPLVICRDFIVDGIPSFRISTTQEDIDFEREKCRFARDDEPTDQELEVTALLRKISEGIVDYGAFVMHGAVIAFENKAYLFTGKSGTGKSTHIYLWKKNLPNAYIVNGDKPFILAGETPMACGSPWTGKEGVFTNTMVPLAAIVVMERYENNDMRRISFSEAFPTLFQQIYRPADGLRMRKTLDMLKALNGKVAFYRFKFNNLKDDCFEVAYTSLVGERK